MLIYTMMIIGLSMLPAIEPGLHNVSVADRDNLDIGHIYCYNYDKRAFAPPHLRYICHRLVNITDDGLLQFHGDNNGAFYDPLTERKNVALEVLV